MKQQGRFRHLPRFIAFMLLATLTNLVSQVAWAGNLFSGPINSPAGRYPGALAAGDFNGDGFVDLAIANANSNQPSSQVKILLGNGNGTFQKPAGYKVGYNPSSVAAGDFNGDGKVDLVIANHPDRLSVLLGNGDGTFQHQTRYYVGQNPWRVAVGDLNGDGELDLAVAGESEAGTQIVRLGNGDGTFQPPTRVPAIHDATHIALGDVNGDGKLDWVITSENNRRAITTLLGNGDGTFRIASTLKNPPPSAIALGDFNGDGKLDLAVTSDKLRIWLGNGDGSFKSGSKYTVARSPVAIAVADFDGDGNLDIAVASQLSGEVSVFLGLGNGNFQQLIIFALSPVAMPIAMNAVDVNNDGRPDLVVTDKENGVVSVLLNTGKK